MLRYRILARKYAAEIAIAICLIATIALAIAFPTTDIEIHHAEQGMTNE